MFSLCGLNCGLCPMRIRGECGGCFSDSPCYPSCPIAPCSVRHGNVDYCFRCGEYPCKRYDGIDRYDSLISHRNQKKDMAKAKEIGIEAYLDEQREKKKILHHLLSDYDDGGKDVFFCLAVNMMDLDDLHAIVGEAEAAAAAMSLSAKSRLIVEKLRARAAQKNIPLVLRKR